ncbi:MAG: hypothetical protein V1891_00265 [bacterium]
MFEDLKPQSKKSETQNTKLEIKEIKGEGAEDIFKDVEENKNKPFLKGVDKAKKAKMEKENIRDDGNKKRFIFIGASVGAVVVIIIFFIFINKFGSFGFSRMFIFNEKENLESEDRMRDEEAKEGADGEEGEESKFNPADAEIEKSKIENQKSVIIDSDGDGLSDEDEGKLGLNKNKVDTDDDNLSDREEIMVYKTDPLNSDSDSDGYSDGNEVNAGYNPKGEGKLYGKL